MQTESNNLSTQKRTLPHKNEYCVFLTTLALSYFPTIANVTILNVFFGTMINSDNLDWDLKTRSKNQSFLTSVYFIGSFAGIICSSFVVNANPKKLLSILRVSSLITAIPFVFTSNENIMAVSRILTGLLNEILHVTILWVVYDVALTRHRVLLMSTFFMSVEASSVVISFLGSLDDRGAVFWRIAYLMPGVLSCVLTLVDLCFVRNLNSPLFILKAFGSRKALEQLEPVYGKKAARDILKRLKVNSKQKESKIEKRLEDLEEKDQLDQFEEIKIQGHTKTTVAENEPLLLTFRLKSTRRGSSLKNGKAIIYCLVVVIFSQFLTSYDLFGLYSVLATCKNLSDEQSC